MKRRDAKLRKDMNACGVTRIEGRAFGRPCVHHAIPVETIADRFRAGEDTDEIATDYDIPEMSVIGALRFVLLYPKCDLGSFVWPVEGVKPT